MQSELTEMVGAKIYDRFVALVRERERMRSKGVPLPHPAVRTRSARSGIATGAVSASTDVTA
jgi:hypothetical protein